MRAYKAADTSGDGFIERREFKKLLHYLVYFNGLWHKFEELDKDGDHRLSLHEFKALAARVGHGLTLKAAAAEFAAMGGKHQQRAAWNGEGFVLFDEFCGWCGRRHVQSLGEEEEGDVEEGEEGEEGEEALSFAGQLYEHGHGGKPVDAQGLRQTLAAVGTVLEQRQVDAIMADLVGAKSPTSVTGNG
eukprot:SAG22_NODE_1562_length_4115_cov_3.076693_3_plen_187_part_01